jgi:hypothetical protein
MGATVLAAPTTNDNFAGATLVTLGFSEFLDTTEATTEPDDALLGPGCGAPATDASVWYALTATEDTRVLVDASGSDYNVNLIVSRSKLAEDVVACAPRKALFFAGAGITYYVLAFDADFGGNGGNLSISFNKVPPPSLDLTIDPTGHFNTKTGAATVSGAYICSGIFSFLVEGTCDGMSHPWSAEVFPTSGKFKGGKAQTVADTFSCDDPFAGCIGPFVEKTVQLSGGSNAGASAAATGVHLFLPSVQGSQPAQGARFYDPS